MQPVLVLDQPPTRWNSRDSDPHLPGTAGGQDGETRQRLYPRRWLIDLRARGGDFERLDTRTAEHGSPTDLGLRFISHEGLTLKGR
jgi:hypothetical protein